MKEILFADDHALLRKGLIQLLKENGILGHFHEIANGRSALQKIQTTSFDLIILDISMPELSGMEILRQIQKENIKTPVVILTMFSDSSYKIEATRMGASAYISKSDDPKLLIQAVHDLLYPNQTFAKPNPSNISSRVAKLTPREIQVVLCILQGFSTNEIAQKIQTKSSSVYTYKNRAFQKLNIQSPNELFDLESVYKISSLMAQ